MAATIAVVVLAAVVAAFWFTRKRPPPSGHAEAPALAPTPVREPGTGGHAGSGSAAPIAQPPTAAMPSAAGPSRGASDASVAMPDAPVDPAEQAIASLRRAARFGYAPLKDGQDNFSVILGIDTATAELLRANAIKTFAMLAATPARTLARLLEEGNAKAPPGGHDHWPLQARLCVRGEWEELKALQQQLRAS